MELRIHKTSDYTVLSNHYLTDNKLSLKTKGLLSVMLSLSRDCITLKKISSISKECEKTLKSIFKELKQSGYLVIRKKRNTESGRYEYECNIYEVPQIPDAKSPDAKSPGVKSPGVKNVKVANLSVNGNISDKNKRQISDNKEKEEDKEKVKEKEAKRKSKKKEKKKKKNNNNNNNIHTFNNAPESVWGYEEIDRNRPDFYMYIQGLFKDSGYYKGPHAIDFIVYNDARGWRGIGGEYILKDFTVLVRYISRWMNGEKV